MALSFEEIVRRYYTILSTLEKDRKFILTLSDIEKRTGINLMSISRALNYFEKKGWIEIRPTKWGKKPFVTEKGKEVIDAFKVILGLDVDNALEEHRG